MSYFTEDGALEVYEGFLRHKGRQDSQNFEQQPRNIILTGFGLFAGVDYNVSGALAESLGYKSVHSDTQSVTFKNGTLKETDCGVRVIDRKITLNDLDYNLRVLLLDVLWDFSGAVLSYEMQKLNPLAVLMMGRGNDSKVIFEAGALNIATDSAGYCSNGEISKINIPTDTLMFSKKPLELDMSWNNKKAADAFTSKMKNKGFEVYTPKVARDENTYVCNNISYMALLTAFNIPFTAANKKISLTPNLKIKPQVGFLHIPKNISFDSDNLEPWVCGIERVLASMV